MPIDREQATKIREDRTGQRGDPRDRHRLLGRTWAAMLSEWLDKDIPAIPGQVVSLMMVQLKLMRACRWHENNDHYVDAQNYLDFAFEDKDSRRENDNVITDNS